MDKSMKEINQSMIEINKATNESDSQIRKLIGELQEINHNLECECDDLESERDRKYVMIYDILKAPLMDCLLAYSLFNTTDDKSTSIPISKQAFIDLYNSIEAKYDEAQITELLSKVEGKEYNVLVTEGRKKMSSFTASSAPKAAEAKTEEKKEEKVDDKKEENMDVDFDLFEGF